MNIEVTPTKVTITNEDLTINKGEYHINDCQFIFSQEYNNLIKRAVFIVSSGKSYVVEIENDTCIIPEQVLRFSDKCNLGVYAYINENDKLLLRYSPEPTSFKLNKGSYISDAEHYVPVKPVRDLIDEYNQNAVEKTNQFNQNAVEKTNQFNQNTVEKTNAFNQNAVEKTNQFNQNAVEKTNAFNQNAVEKTNAFEDFVADEIVSFDEHVQRETTKFDDNAQEKTDILNQIAEGIEDMTTAIQFATFEVDNNMGLYIVQADRLINTNFIFNPETGGLEVMIA